MKVSEVDIIILSNAKTQELQGLTVQTIETLKRSELEDKVKFNILVIESNRSLAPMQFVGSTTLYPEQPFGFHRYLNIGIKATTSEYVCLCNNDLIFHEGWTSNILDVFADHPDFISANPICDQFEPHRLIDKSKPYILANRKNIFNGILTGWCIFTRRSLFDKIGFLDEQYDFWYADRDYGRTLLKYQLKHVLVTNSVVTHIGNMSHDTIEQTKVAEFTHQQKLKYEKKWGTDQSFFEHLKAHIKNFIKR